MKAALLFCLMTAQALAGGLERYADLILKDPGPDLVPAGIRITYLGTNGYQLETADGVLLIDPYFTRVGLLSAVFNTRIRSKPERVAHAMASLREQADGVLVTHAHFDHLLDVPAVMRRTGARLVAGETAVNLARAQGLPEKQCRVVWPGDRLRLGSWKIRVLTSAHDKVLGRVPFRGQYHEVPEPPRKAGDWVLGEPMAFVIESRGLRVYVDSGGRPEALPPADVGPVDLAILGVALPDSRRRLPQVLARLRPRYVLPSHQDNFFRPLRKGFTFGMMTDFPDVLRSHRRSAFPSRILLLDYFAPWTLTKAR